MAATSMTKLLRILPQNSRRIQPFFPCLRCTVVTKRAFRSFGHDGCKASYLLRKHIGNTIDGVHSGTSFGRLIHTSPAATAISDPYKVLGVPKNASQKDIKKAYYELAKKYHPDRNKDNKDAAKRFAEIAEAYEVLGDEARRREYDTVGASGFGGGGFQQGQWQGQQMDPEELFRKIFGNAGFGMGTGGDSPFGDSIFGGLDRGHEVMMDLTFSEAARGVNKDVTVTMEDTCERCKGNRAEPGTKTTKCHRCNGTGQETINTGPFVMRTTCRQCRGMRVIVTVPCMTCRGAGTTMQRKKVTVPVPAGVEDGQTVRMPVGNRELFITFRVARSQTFRRDGADVHSDVTVSFTQAALGGSLKIKGIYDSIHLSIPAGTQSHTRIRLPGKGISRVNGYGYGDHYVHIKIQVPTKLTSKQRALLLAFAEEETGVSGTIDGTTKTGDESQTEETLSDEEKEKEPGFFRRLIERVRGF
ncbi:dnaJ homolog subfamily A member 3, mitochondrial-like isoform X2 [Acanthaster planci]|uniref:DnaJ homolog subfamily A member 3, mitochondrial-like isoform X2 n=1 Tax=Acanthaster planci TaxID=133434 RepID=A0A8B7Z3S9_ACAPL|nr:dnaJ homolog subfamily A member 3, mitochondrial-like isoform X2 [Acanthaster planci]